MWEAQLLGMAKGMSTAIGTAVMTMGNALAPGVAFAVGAAIIAAGNSIQVNMTTGERSMKMTDQAAVSTAVSIATAYIPGAGKALGNALGASATVVTQTLRAASTLAQAGMRYDEKGRSQGWSLEGKRGDAALFRAGASALASYGGDELLPENFGGKADWTGSYAQSFKNGMVNSLPETLWNTATNTLTEYAIQTSPAYREHSGYKGLTRPGLGALGRLAGGVIAAGIQGMKKRRALDEYIRKSELGMSLDEYMYANEKSDHNDSGLKQLISAVAAYRRHDEYLDAVAYHAYHEKNTNKIDAIRDGVAAVILKTNEGNKWDEFAQRLEKHADSDGNVSQSAIDQVILEMGGDPSLRGSAAHTAKVNAIEREEMNHSNPQTQSQSSSRLDLSYVDGTTVTTNIFEDRTGMTAGACDTRGRTAAQIDAEARARLNPDKYGIPAALRSQYKSIVDEAVITVMDEGDGGMAALDNEIRRLIKKRMGANMLNQFDYGTDKTSFGRTFIRRADDMLHESGNFFRKTYHMMRIFHKHMNSDFGTADTAMAEYRPFREAIDRESKARYASQEAELQARLDTMSPMARLGYLRRTGQNKFLSDVALTGVDIALGDAPLSLTVKGIGALSKARTAAAAVRQTRTVMAAESGLRTGASRFLAVAGRTRAGRKLQAYRRARNIRRIREGRLTLEQAARRVSASTPSWMMRSAGSAAHPVYRSVEKVAQKYSGRFLENQGWLEFPTRRSARKAAAEILGDLGAQPSKIRLNQFEVGQSQSLRNKRWRFENSKKVIGKESLDGTRYWRDDYYGHDFPDGTVLPPHVNVGVDGIDFHLFYRKGGVRPLE